jgi:glycosyltransferase involved in cell wall biosynthesis
MENIHQRGIYSDLVRELDNRGVNIYVVSPREKRTSLQTELFKQGNTNNLRVKTGNITKINLIEKCISTLSIERQYLRAINKCFIDTRFDAIIYSTPPITFEKIIRNLKKEHGCKTYLIFKDIFPQNAVDINLIKEGSIIWRYFRNKEKRLYKLSDKIGCMSRRNAEYILKHNSFINENNVEVFPNSINPIEKIDLASKNKDNEYLRKYNIPKDLTLFIYGGNLGKPQGIDFLLKVIDNFYLVQNGYLLIVGSGTEYERIKNHIQKFKPKNVSLIYYIPKIEFDELLQSTDVGLIFLDKRFTIPNIPSRLTSYMECSLPILAATDLNTDLRVILDESKSGFWSESGDINSFIMNANKLSANKDLRLDMGMKGRKYLEDNYDIRKNIDIILKHL